MSNKKNPSAAELLELASTAAKVAAWLKECRESDSTSLSFATARMNLAPALHSLWQNPLLYPGGKTPPWLAGWPLPAQHALMKLRDVADTIGGKIVLTETGHCWHQSAKDWERTLQDAELLARAAATLKASVEAETTTKPVVEKVTPNGLDIATLPDPITAGDLAKALGMTRHQVNSRLARIRRDYPDCFYEVPNPRRNQARILYRTDEVIRHLKS